MGQSAIAVVPLIGTMRKYDTTSSTECLVRQAQQDSEVEGIFLLVDSPGGEVGGTESLADAVYAAALAKPVVAFVDGNCASAAYWVASQATRAYALKSAQVGGIGAFAVVEDSSSMLDDLGVKVHVVRSGPAKGGPVSGAPVSKDQLAEVQQMVDTVSTQFQAAVCRGRSKQPCEMSPLSDGRVFFGEDASRLGLIDGTCSRDEAVQFLFQLIRDSHAPLAGAASIPTQTMKTPTQEAGLIEKIRSLLGLTLVPTTFSEPVEASAEQFVQSALAASRILPYQADPLKQVAVLVLKADQAEGGQAHFQALHDFVSGSAPSRLTQNLIPAESSMMIQSADGKSDRMVEAKEYLGRDPLAKSILAELQETLR